MGFLLKSVKEDSYWEFLLGSSKVCAIVQKLGTQMWEFK